MQDRCPTCHRRHKRSNPQNALYWQLLGMMEDRKWNGEQYSDKAFHIYYRKRILGCDDVTLPNGEVISTPRSTANLDVAEFATYFDAVQADCAERGVFLADMETA